MERRVTNELNSDVRCLVILTVFVQRDMRTAAIIDESGISMSTHPLFPYLHDVGEHPWLGQTR